MCKGLAHRTLGVQLVFQARCRHRLSLDVFSRGLLSLKLNKEQLFQAQLSQGAVKTKWQSQWE